MNAKTSFLSLAALAAFAACAAKLEFSADHPDALYACGAEATITVKALGDDGKPLASGSLEVWTDSTGTNASPRRTVDLAKENPVVVKGTLAQPGFLRVRAKGVVKDVQTWSVGYEPERIVQGAPRPADFDAYWDGEKARLAKEVPLDPKMTLAPELSKGAWNFWRVNFATFSGKRVYGFLSAPKKKGKWPVRVNVPGAGPWQWTMGGSANSVNLVLNVFPFDPPKTKEGMKKAYDEFTRAQAKKYDCGGYSTAGIGKSREEYFFHDAILGIDRAVDWVAQRDDVDLADFTYSGSSQGGAFGFFLCGLNKHFTKGVMHVPAMCDHFGFRVGRANGWPQLVNQSNAANRAGAEKWAAYFDACNFAPRIKIPVRVSVGFADTCCAAPSVYAAYNAIASVDKRIIRGIGMPHGVFGDVSAIAEAWRSGKSPRKATAGDLKTALRQMPAGHPRLFVPTRDAFARVREQVKRDPKRKALADAIVKKADSYLGKPCAVRSMEGFRMRGQHVVSSRLIAWSSAYALTLDRKYFDAARAEMLSACKWCDWNPKHYLDTAEMQLGFSVAYDWMFDLFSEQDRKDVRAALVKFGLTSMNTKGTGWWRDAYSNWQQVCWDGACTAALAIWEDEKDLSEKILLEAINKLPTSTEPYGPAGTYPEGPGYWSYGTTRFVYLLDMFHNALGTDFGLSEIPGFFRTGEFRAQCTGPSGRTFNYSDNGDKRGFEQALVWLAQKTGNPGTCEYERAQLMDGKHGAPGSFPMLFFFWNDWSSAPAAGAALPLDYSSQGHCPIVCTRSAWTKDAAFLAAKGGRANYNHAHQDIGTFVYDLDGVRWAEDLGSQGYYSIEKLGMNLWTMAQNGDRWKVFRQSPKSHNMVTIDLADINVAAFASVTDEKSTPDGFSAQINLGKIYAGRGASDATRFVSLDRASRVATIEDRFEGIRRGGQARWAMVTGAKEIKIVGNDVILSNGGGKSALVRAEYPANVIWTVTDIAKGPNSWDCENKGRKILSFTRTVSCSGDYAAKVTLGPVNR